MREDIEDIDDSPKPAAYSIPEYARFDTTIGDEYSSCCKELEVNGTMFAVSDVGKKVTEHLCRILRSEGFSADWHAIKNSVSTKTLEKGDRLLQLKKRWRSLVVDYSSGRLRIR